MGYTSPVGNYESRVVEDLTGPLDEGDFPVRVQLHHTSGRLYSFEVNGEFRIGFPVVEIWLGGGEEYYLHPDALASIVRAISLSTMPVVHWRSDVEGAVDGYGDE